MKKCLIAGVSALALTTAAHGAVEGEFVSAGTVTTFTDGPVDLYNFVVTTTAGEGLIEAFDFTTATGGGFSGSFIQGSATFRTDPSLDEPAPTFIIADTFFVSPIASPTAVNTVDTTVALESAFAFTASPVDASSGVIVATFSVAPGGNAPTFEGGFAVIDSSDVAINLVPEPSSMALLGLGGLFLARRRRNG